MTASTPHPGPALPKVREIVRRFNEACRAFDEAVTASQARAADQYEAGLLRSAREMGSALELAVVRRVGSARPDLVSKRLEFPQLLDHLVDLHVLPLAGGRCDQLRRWRRLRNEAEHAPVRVPPLSSLLEALRGVRRFLVDALDSATDLHDPDHPFSTPAPAHDGRPGAPILLDDEHRKESPDAWVRARIDEGLGRLNAGRAESPPLRDGEVRRSLLGMARDLAERRSGPGDPIPNASTAVKAIDDHSRLYMEAGWLVEVEEGICFRDPRLPALLLGIELAGRGSNAKEKRTALGSLGTWAEAAWAATAAGDLAHDWLRPLLDGSDLYCLPDRVITACAALAGLGTIDRATADLVKRAAEIAGEALVWLIPVPQAETKQAVVEHRDVWRLPRFAWQRAVLDVAKVTRDLPHAEHSRNTEPGVRSLERWVTALGLAPRVSDATARAVRVLCCPWPRGGISSLDESFFQALWSLPDGLGRHVDRQFLEIWMVEAGIPALWKGDARRAARLLVVAERHHPAGFLLNRPELLSYWSEAWVCFAETEPAEEAVRAWVNGATWAVRTGGLDDGVAEFFLSDAPARLRALGAWNAALAKLEEELTAELVPTQPDERHNQYCAALFAKVGLSLETWRQKIDEWSKSPSLPWKTLLMAGAPHDALARWCLDKLRQKDLEKIQVDGPVGVIVSAGQVLKTEGWELAYDQARDALQWLLEQGDESAVAVLADRCFAEKEEQRINPSVRQLKKLQLHVLLSQDLWGRVTGRPSGRAALYARVEREQGLGKDGHFWPDQWVATDAEVWEQLAYEVGLRDSLLRAPTDDEVAEARRLFAAFERWMTAQLPGIYRLMPERTPWADPAMRPAKTFMVICGALRALDVTEQFHTLLQSIVDDAQLNEAPLLQILGQALDHLCSRPGEPPKRCSCSRRNPR